MRRSFPAGVHRAGASRTCHPGRYAALPSPDPIHNFRSYLTVLTDQRPEDSEGAGVIIVGRFKGDPYDGVQLSYDAGRRKLYLTPEGALRLAFLLAAAVETAIDIP
jgi:hypothetical protein